jgi:hypothetical protein
LPTPVTVIRVDSGHLLPVTSPAAFAEMVAGQIASGAATRVSDR